MQLKRHADIKENYTLGGDMVEFDINAANIACGRMDYLQRQIELHALLKVQVAA